MIHLQGILLFLFIPLVLYLFLQYPAGIFPSFVAAIFLMFAHRLVARPFFLRNKNARCFWCGRAGKPRAMVRVQTGKESVEIEFCKDACEEAGGSFLAFTDRYRSLLRVGIFVPLVWYIVTMLLDEFGIFDFPREWNRFIFQFFIALTVGIISFAYRSVKRSDEPEFAFPIHNLFLLGARNTLLVFRYVGFWWLAVSVLFLYQKLAG